MADNDSYKEEYYFKFGEPGGANYRPGKGCDDAIKCGEIDPSNTHFNRAYLNIDQYNYLATRINQIRKVRPLTFEDHYRMYPYRSGEMIVPKELYTIEWEMKARDTSQVYSPGGHFYWGNSLYQAMEHWKWANPAESEEDIVYTTTLDPKAGPWSALNGSRCGRFLEYDGCGEGHGHWESSPDSACADPYADASQLFEIVTVRAVTGWSLNRGGGGNVVDEEGGIDSMVNGEYDLPLADLPSYSYSLDSTYTSIDRADVSTELYPWDPYRRTSDAPQNTPHPFWLNVVKKLNKADSLDADYNAAGEGGTEIPVFHQEDYPAPPVEAAADPYDLGPWAALMEESGSALEDTIKSHTYDIKVEAAGGGDVPLKDPEGMAGQWYSLNPRLRRKVGTLKNDADYGGEYPIPNWWDPIYGGHDLDPGMYPWGNLPVDNYMNLSKTTQFTIDSQTYQVVDPLEYDQGIEYDIAHAIGPLGGAALIEDSTKDYLAQHNPCRRADTQSCRWECKEIWDDFFDQYSDCVAECVSTTFEGRAWKRAFPGTKANTLSCSTYRFIDATSYYFDGPRDLDFAGGGFSSPKIWHNNFYEVDRIRNERGINEGEVGGTNWAMPTHSPLIKCGIKDYFGNHDPAAVGGLVNPPGGGHYYDIGTVTNFKAYIRHVENFGSCHSEFTFPEPMKRKHMLIHPALHADIDPLGWIVNMAMISPEQDSVRHSEAGYAYGMQDNLYNGFTLPPYKTAPGRQGAGGGDYWEGGNDGSVTRVGGDEPGDGYPGDSAVEKVHWIKIKDVQKRAKELGFHFEFRRLTVPYKMIEVEFDHEVSKFARMSGNALYTRDKWTSTIGYQEDREICQPVHEAGNYEDGNMKSAYEPQFRMFRVGDGLNSIVHRGMSANGRYGCGLRRAGGAAEDGLGGAAYHVYGKGLAEGQHDDDMADAVDPIIWGAKLMQEHAGMYDAWSSRGTPVYLPWRIVFNEIGSSHSAESTAFPNADGGDHAGFWNQLGGSNKSHMSWWEGYDTHSLIFLGKKVNQNTAEITDWDNFSRGGSPIIGGSDTKYNPRCSLEDEQGTPEIAGHDVTTPTYNNHGPNAPAKVHDNGPYSKALVKYSGPNSWIGQSQFYQLHIKRGRDGGAGGPLYIYKDFEEPGLRPENYASTIAEDLGEPRGPGYDDAPQVHYTTQDPCTLDEYGNTPPGCCDDCPELDATDKSFVTHYQNWSVGGEAMEDNDLSAPYDKDGAWPINVANLVDEAGIAADGYGNEGWVDGFRNAFDLAPKGGSLTPNAKELITEIPGDWTEGDGTFGFKTMGYVPHIKKTHQFATAANEEETEWVRPIGLGTLKHITEPFSGYDIFTTDFVKRQAAFSCDPHTNAGTWGNPSWSRTECDLSRHENPRLDNDSAMWLGNMIFPEVGGDGYLSSSVPPVNALIEKDWVTFWPFDVTSYVEWGEVGAGGDILGWSSMLYDNEIWDNVDLLGKNWMNWSMDKRKSEMGTDKKVWQWMTKMKVSAGPDKYRMGVPLPKVFTDGSRAGLGWMGGTYQLYNGVGKQAFNREEQYGTQHDHSTSEAVGGLGEGSTCPNVEAGPLKVVCDSWERAHLDFDYNYIYNFDGYEHKAAFITGCAGPDCPDVNGEPGGCCWNPEIADDKPRADVETPPVGYHPAAAGGGMFGAGSPPGGNRWPFNKKDYFNAFTAVDPLNLKELDLGVGIYSTTYGKTKLAIYPWELMGKIGYGPGQPFGEAGRAAEADLAWADKWANAWFTPDAKSLGFVNISLYDMLYHYDQTALLKVIGDGDSFDLYKAELLKLQNKRNPNALLYQDYTDYYSSEQFNQVFMFGEEDYQFEDNRSTLSLLPGYAISSIALSEPVRQQDYLGPYYGVEQDWAPGPADDTNMVSTFLRVSTEAINFGGRKLVTGPWGPTALQEYWMNDLEPHSTYGYSAYSSRPQIWRPILKTSSLPMVDVSFLPKSKLEQSNYEGSTESIKKGEGGIGLCPTCTATEYFIGGAPNVVTTAINFYIENMIDLSTEEDQLAVKNDRLAWEGPNTDVTDNTSTS